EEKKVSAHISYNELFKSMTQRPDGEKELITGSSTGQISVWDYDAPDAVFTFSTGVPINSVAISPSGNCN
ncbi:MAG: hypothetical protein EZS28_056137, partial [Streblomastix strix]